MSQVVGCVDAAATYLLSTAEACEIVDHQLVIIERDWIDIRGQTELSAIDRARFWSTAFLNPYAREGYHQAR